MELVRYIHLNPLRAKLVIDMDALGKYPFSGHGVIMGKHTHPWQDIEKVLAFFGKQTGPARRGYRAFVAKGIDIEMKSEHLWMPGKSRQQMTSRSLLCFWAVRELGESMASLAKRLNISTTAVSKSVVRGAEIADREGYELI